MTEYMDMSDPSVQQMLDDDKAEALARIRAEKADNAHWALLDSVGVTAEQREEILKRARPSYRSNNK